jgi:hypothetical protein
VEIATANERINGIAKEDVVAPILKAKMEKTRATTVTITTTADALHMIPTNIAPFINVSGTTSSNVAKPNRTNVQTMATVTAMATMIGMEIAITTDLSEIDLSSLINQTFLIPLILTRPTRSTILSM